MPLHGRKKVSQAIHDLTVKQNDNLKKILFVLFRDIIKETPVTTGRARNNWFLSLSAPSNKTTTVSGGGQNISLPENILGKKIFLTNNLPYIGALEYGGYPDPVKQGTRQKDGSFKILSLAGFSKKAKTGWVRKALIRAQNKIRNS